MSGKRGAMLRLIFCWILLLASVVEAQVPAPQIPVTGNIGSGGNFPVYNHGTINISGNYTMTYPDMSAEVIRFTGTLSTAATITAPQGFGFEFSVQNATTGGQSIVFKGPTGTGVTIPNGQTMTVLSDGTNYVSVGGGIQSINTDTAPAQRIAAGNGINVATSNGTTTISNTGVVSEVIFSGVSDAVKDTTCSVTNGSPNLTCTDAPFATCPTGKTISVTNGILESWTSGGTAYTRGNSLITTIQSCNSATVAVLGKNATNTATNIPARWGTDNGPALLAQANASTTAGHTFVIPPGNYLVRTTMPANDAVTGNAIDVYPNTAYIVQGHIYWIGPLGCDGNDGTCTNSAGTGEDGFRLFHLHDAGEYNNTGTWPPAQNVHIEVDGIIEGDILPTDVGTTYNQSGAIGWFGYGKVGTAIDGVHDVVVDGVGTLLNLYGFGIHGVIGFNTNARRLTFDHVTHALNMNGDHSDQSFNVIRNGGGTLEAAGSYETIIGNRFDSVGGISLGGVGQNAACVGDVVADNVFTNMTQANLQIAMCPVGAVIVGNRFWTPSGSLAGPPSAINFHDGPDATTTHDNLITGNLFDGASDCYADVVSFGVYTGASVFSGNHQNQPCYYGYLFYNGYRSGAGTPLIRPEIVKNDSLLSRSGQASVIVEQDDVVRLQGTVLDVGPTLPSNSYTVDSYYSNPSGQMHSGMVMASFAQIQSLPSIRTLGTDATGNVVEGTNFPQGTGIPTFTTLYFSGGYNSVGGSNYDANALQTWFVAFTPTLASTLRDEQVYIGAMKGSVATKIYGAIYDSNGTSATDGSSGAPGTKLCADTLGTIGVANAWNKLPLFHFGTCPSFTAGHKYFLGYTIDQLNTLYFDNATFDGTTYGYTATAAGTWPSPISASNSSAHISAYVDLYNSAGGWGTSYNPSNPIPPTMLGTGAIGNGTECLLDNQTWGACSTGGGGGSPSGAAGGDLSGTYPNPGVAKILGTAVPTLASGYLHYTGTAFAWDSAAGMVWPTGGTGIPNYNGSSGWGSTYTSSSPIPANMLANPLTQNTSGNAATASAVPVSGLSNATAAHSISNSAFAQTWQCSFTGSTTNYCLHMTESAPSTNALAAILQADTGSGSAAIPFKATAGGTANGVQVATNGNITALGTGIFVGPVQLPGTLASKSSLGTDSSGNIIAGTGGGGAPLYEQQFLNVPEVATAAGINLSSFAGECSSTTPYPCTAVTPSGDTSYRMTVQITQTSVGTSCTGGGSLQLWLSYTDPDSLVNITNSVLSMIGVAGTTYSGTMATSPTTLSGGTTFNAIPLTVRVKGSSSFTYNLRQTVATAGCTTTQPTVTMRIQFWPGT